MDELLRAGKTGIFFKATDALRTEARRFKIDVSKTARAAIAAAVREAARREHLAKRRA